MANAIYYACGKCEYLLDENDDGKVSCPHCKYSFYRTDGENYPNMDDEDYNNGFPRKEVSI